MKEPETMRELIDALSDAADFLKRLNHFWFSELKTSIAKGEELISHPNDADCEVYLEEISYMLFGKNQLGELFVSSPVKRDKFNDLIDELKAAYQKVKVTVS